MKKVNDKFYTETVEDKLVFEMTNIKCDLSTLVNSLNGMIDSLVLKGADWSEGGVENIFATLNVEFKKGQVEDIPMIVCRMSGSKPWTKEQVEEFERVINEEREEMKLLQQLIEKHPNKSFSLFSKMMSEKLEETAGNE